MTDGQSLLQKAWLRGAVLDGVAEILTVTNRELHFKTEDEYREVASIPANNDLAISFILERFGRNTAPAIAAAALQVSATHGDDASMLVLVTDHLYADHPSFVKAVATAMQLAAQGKLVTFGIQPSLPQTGYGYIEADGYTVKRFVEKPSLDKAKEYVASGRYLWNSGMFCFQAGTMLHEMQEHCPAFLDATRACIAKSRSAVGRGFSQLELDASLFKQVPDDSIDYAIIEKSANVDVVPCNIGWSDIGSWAALGDLTAPDAQGNRIEGEVILQDVCNCYIQSSQRIVGAVGVKDLVIIDTPDAVMIADCSSAQDVKHIYARLKAKGHEVHRLHRTVHRPWGTSTVLEEGPHFKIKCIEVKPNASLNLQMHHHRSEHWIVVSGRARVVNGQQELFVQTNESNYIPAGHKHRLENPDMLPLILIEVQTGEYLGEDDIVPFDDVYGRK